VKKNLPNARAKLHSKFSWNQRKTLTYIYVYVPARCQPNVIFFEIGRDAILSAKILIIKLLTSVNKWLASVMTAKLLAK